MNSKPRHPSDPVSSADASDALPLGFEFDGFRVERVLAVRSFGIVYLARDLTLDCPVAIKEYFPSTLARRVTGGEVTTRSASHEESYQSGLHIFVQEAQMLARCDHPALLRVTRLWRTRGTAYRVMPHYPGKMLLSRRRAMTAPPGEIWLRTFIDDLCGALEVVHDAGLVHRRLMPSNILIRPDDHPVLLDFDAVRHALGSSRVQSLMAAVSPSFAPEEPQPHPDLPQTASSDLHALAATVHFCITGQPLSPVWGPGAKRDSLEQVLTHLRAAYPALTYSRSFIHAIDRALHPNPAQWPRNVGEFRTWLAAEPVPSPAAAPAPIAEEPAPADSADFMAFFAAAPDTTHRGRPGSGVPPPGPARARDKAFPQGATEPSLAGDNEPRMEFFPSVTDRAGTGPAARPTARGTAAQPQAPTRPGRPMIEPGLDRGGPASSGDPAAAGAAHPAFGNSAFASNPGSAGSTFGQSSFGESTLGLGSGLAPLDRPSTARRLLPWGIAAVLTVAALFGAWKFQDQLRHDRVLMELARTATSANDALPRGAASATEPEMITEYRTPTAGGTSTLPSTAMRPDDPTALNTPGAAATDTPGNPPPRTEREIGESAALDSSAVPLPSEATAVGPAPPPARAETPTTDAAPPPERQGAGDAAKSTVRSPKEACGNRVDFALYRCMQTQCARAQWTRHPSCQRLRATDEVTG